MPKPKTTRQPRLFLPEQLARIENGVDTEAYPLADTWAWVESIQDALRDDQQEWDKANGRGNYLKQSGIVEREVEFDRWGKPIRPLKAEKTKHSWAKLWEVWPDENLLGEALALRDEGKSQSILIRRIQRDATRLCGEEPKRQVIQNEISRVLRVWDAETKKDKVHLKFTEEAKRQLVRPKHNSHLK